jgi:hypothetical protein
MLPLAAWTDVGIFCATAAGVVVTLGAVLVALFGPGWDRRRRGPRVTISTSFRTLQTKVFGSEIVGLVLHNKRGCDTARDVEVFVSLTFAVDGVTGVVGGDQASLNFEDPTEEGPGRPTASVPPGFARGVNLAVLSEPNDEDRRIRDVAYLALYPTRLAHKRRLHEGRTYEVSITATGSNFDAVSYIGHLAFSELGDDGEISVEWKDLKPSDKTTVDRMW